MKKVLDFVKRNKTFIAIWLVILIWSIVSDFRSEPPNQVAISQVDTMIAEKVVTDATFYNEQHLIKIQTDKGEFQAVYSDGYDTVLANELKTAGASFTVAGNDIPKWLWLLKGLAPWIFAAVIIMTVIITFGKALKDPIGSMIGKTDFIAERPKERYSDIDGADEVIEKLSTLKDFLENPEKYEGVQMERGVILEGTPGNGKTLVAKATAGEAGVPFFNLSGSSLTSMWAGGTTQRIEKFFELIRKEVKKNEACLVFVDEIDGIASRRAGSQGADRDHNTSVTQLLHQVTSLFADYPRAVIISATNNLAVLDDAVTRPGRFGMHIAMPNPDKKDREAILSRNIKTHSVGESVSIDLVGEMTVGMSGAAVAAIPHSAALLARRQRGIDAKIEAHNIEQAAMEAVFGVLRWSADVKPADRRLAGVHEAGHAVLAHESPYHQLIVITDVPIGRSGGSTWCPLIESLGMDRDSLVWSMAVAMGGRESEIMSLGKPSSGPAHDIESATNLALQAICQWGIFDEFLTKIDVRKWDTHPRADEIDAKVQELMGEARKRAQEVLKKYTVFRQAIIDKLDKNRILHSDEIEDLVLEYALVPAQ